MKQLIFLAIIMASIPSYSLAMKYHPNFSNNLSNETITIIDTGNGPCAMGRPNRQILCSIGPKQKKSIDLSYLTIVFTTKAMKGTMYFLEIKEATKNVSFIYSKKENYIDIFFDGKFSTTFENTERHLSKK